MKNFKKMILPLLLGLTILLTIVNFVACVADPVVGDGSVCSNCDTMADCKDGMTCKFFYSEASRRSGMLCAYSTTKTCPL